MDGTPPTLQCRHHQRMPGKSLPEEVLQVERVCAQLRGVLKINHMIKLHK